MFFRGSLMFVIQKKLGLIHKKLRHWCLHHKKTHGINWKQLSEDLALIGQRVHNMDSG